MSRKNGTNRAGAAIGMNPYGWGNGGKRKRPTGVGAPMGQVNKNNNYTPYCIRKNGGCQDGK
jgi:hypothetical protein